jgi:hypothetical protein
MKLVNNNVFYKIVFVITITDLFLFFFLGQEYKIYLLPFLIIIKMMLCILIIIDYYDKK